MWGLFFIQITQMLGVQTSHGHPGLRTTGLELLWLCLQTTFEELKETEWNITLIFGNYNMRQFI